MPVSFDQQVDALKAAVDAHCMRCRGNFLTKTTKATELLLIWLGYLRSTISRQVADWLLDGVHGSVIEVAGCLSLGLVRPAVVSLRVQLELLLAWIYFNDHAVEWSHVQKSVEDFPSRSTLRKYMRDNSTRFTQRFEILAKRKTRKTEDPYGVLSVHVHSTSVFSAPTIGPLSSLVKTDAACLECVDLEAEVAEYLTDTLASWYADRWHDLPAQVTASLRSRVTSAKLSEFCRAGN
jgi:hypothetical protein